MGRCVRQLARGGAAQARGGPARAGGRVGRVHRAAARDVRSRAGVRAPRDRSRACDARRRGSTARDEARRGARHRAGGGGRVRTRSLAGEHARGSAPNQRRPYAGALRHLVRVFPAPGSLRGPAREARAGRGARHRRALPDAVRPISRTNRTGANNPPGRGPERPGSRQRSAGRKAATRRSTRTGPRPGLRAARRGRRDRGSSRARLRVHARPPSIATRTPDSFYQRQDGTLSTPKPAKHYQDIYNLDFECSDWRALWDELRQSCGCRSRAACVSFAWTTLTEAVRVLGIAVDDVRERHPEVDLPRRGLHAAGDDARAVEARLRPSSTSWTRWDCPVP